MHGHSGRIAKETAMSQLYVHTAPGNSDRSPRYNVRVVTVFSDGIVRVLDQREAIPAAVSNANGGSPAAVVLEVAIEQAHDRLQKLGKGSGVYVASMTSIEEHGSVTWNDDQLAGQFGLGQL